MSSAFINIHLGSEYLYQYVSPDVHNLTNFQDVYTLIQDWVPVHLLGSAFVGEIYMWRKYFALQSNMWFSWIVFWASWNLITEMHFSGILILVTWALSCLPFWNHCYLAIRVIIRPNHLCVGFEIVDVIPTSSPEKRGQHPDGRSRRLPNGLSRVPRSRAASERSILNR